MSKPVLMRNVDIMKGVRRCLLIGYHCFNFWDVFIHKHVILIHTTVMIQSNTQSLLCDQAGNQPVVHAFGPYPYPNSLPETPFWQPNRRIPFSEI